MYSYVNRKDKWYHTISHYVNFPILNDRLAIVRGRVTITIFAKVAILGISVVLNSG